MLLSPLGKQSPRKRVNDQLHVEELLTNRDGLLTANLGLFLLNCRSSRDRLFFKTEVRRNPNSFIHEMFLAALEAILSLAAVRTYRRVEEAGVEAVMNVK